MKVVELTKVSKDFHLGKTLLHALKDVDLTVNAGDFLAIAGPSGSGKTTLLNLIGCIDVATSGKIKIDGSDIAGLSPNKLAEIRASKIGFIFQTFNLIPVLTAFENVEYPLLRKKITKHEREQKVIVALENVGLGKFAHHRPDELSGGQRQRVAIARALVSEPKIILADEPTANLDQKTGHDILELMREINKVQGATFIFSTHDPKIMSMANRIVEVMDGMTRKD